MDTRQISCQLDVLRTLHARKYGVTIKELADEYGVHPRTIRRDLYTLGEAGFSIYSDEVDGRTRWFLLQNRGIPPVNFPILEVVALSFIEDILTPLEGTPFKEHFDSALRRIRQTVPEGMKAFLQQASRLYASHIRGQKPYAESRDLLDRLHRAILDRKVCRITYHAFSTGEVKTYPVEPFRIFYHQGGIYMLCRAPVYDQIITLAVERIRKLEVMEETFEAPADLSLDGYLQDAFGIIHEDPVEVRVRFSAGQAPYVAERIWHPSQEIQNLEDGGIILSFRAGGFFEIKAWILSHGAQAEVLEPPRLREEIAAELKGSTRIRGVVGQVKQPHPYRLCCEISSPIYSGCPLL